MQYSQLKKILKNHKLQVTDCRMDILEYFTRAEAAVTQKDLENQLKQYDRVTIYRTLKSFTENGVVHPIPSDTGTVNYGLCYDTCDVEDHHHNHIHFYCESCQQTKCINTHVPDVQVPDYIVHEVNLMLKGICKDCHQD